MDIKFHTNHMDYLDYRSHTPAAAKPPVPGKVTGNYDKDNKDTFRKTHSPVDETSFARILAREAAGRLEQGASPEKVAGLHQQFVTGTYKPDARSIAEHMLGYR